MRCPSEVFTSLPKLRHINLCWLKFQTSISSILFNIFGQKVTNVISGTYRTFWHIFRVYSTTFFRAGLVPLTRAPLGQLGKLTTGPILKIQAAFESPGKTVEGKQTFNDLGVTSAVTGQVSQNVRLFRLVTSASKISMLSSNKANESAWIVSDICKYHFL